MADREYFTIEDAEGNGLRVLAHLRETAEYPNYEEALKAAQGAASASAGPVVIVRWTRTETTRWWREITVKGEDMAKAAESKTP